MRIIKIAGKLVPVVWTLDPETGNFEVLVKAKQGNKSARNARSLLPDGQVIKDINVPDGGFQDDGTGDGGDGGGGDLGVKADPVFAEPVDQVKTGPAKTKVKA